MITWVTVWVLTVGYFDREYNKGGSATYQLQFAKQETCLKEAKKHMMANKDRYNNGYSVIAFTRCDFQQVPVVTK